MLTSDQKWGLIRGFGVKRDRQAEFITLIDTIEGDPSKVGLITQVEQLLERLTEVEAALHKLGTKEAGLTRAAVVEFNDRDRLYFTQGRRDEILSQISGLIGWDWCLGTLAF